MLASDAQAVILPDARERALTDLIEIRPAQASIDRLFEGVDIIRLDEKAVDAVVANRPRLVREG